MTEWIASNLGILTSLVIGALTVWGFWGKAMVKVQKAYDMVAHTKTLLDIVLDSLQDGQITKEELTAIQKQAKEVEDEFRRLIGRKDD